MDHLISFSGYEKNKSALYESLLHNANGYLGIRFNGEDSDQGQHYMKGSYINGLYGTHPIHHPEKLHGFATVGEKMVNGIDCQTTSIRLDGQQLGSESERRNQRCTLDMSQGVSSRHFQWMSQSGVNLRYSSKRMASMVHPNLFLFIQEYQVDRGCTLELTSLANGDVHNFYKSDDPRVGASMYRPWKVQRLKAKAHQGRLELDATIPSTGFTLHTRVLHRFFRSDDGPIYDGVPWEDDQSCALRWTFHMNDGASIRMEKLLIYADDRHFSDPIELIGQYSNRWEREHHMAQTLMEEQENYWSRFWDSCGVEIDGDVSLEQAINFNMYHLAQSTPKNLRGSIPAKGLSGEGYEGHYFWDSEIYMLPFFTYSDPAKARNLLQYRHSILDGARAHARAMGHSSGAAFPWRTIDGRESSAYYPSGSAQYHINGDIAYGVMRYIEATEDQSFLVEYGAELVWEMARLWPQLGSFDSHGYFHIFSVTGPDEYTVLVDDNYYTNRMAQNHLGFAVAIWEQLKENHHIQELAKKIGLSEEEVQVWESLAEHMYIPYDPDRGINPQDRSFLGKPLWDLQNTPREHFPLLLHYHHLTLSRHQVCKQADTVLAHFLLRPKEPKGTLVNSLDYYQSITSHDSSLSYAVFGAMYAVLGKAERAVDFLGHSAYLDLQDGHKNTKDGIHAANTGGAWMAVVWGLGGFFPKGDRVCLSPHIPDTWNELRFNFLYRGTKVRVHARRDHCSVVHLEGPALTVELNGKMVHISAENTKGEGK